VSAEDHAQRVGLVAQRGGARREHALARGAAPELDDLVGVAEGGHEADDEDDFEEHA
jgi:hypothetical protein